MLILQNLSVNIVITVRSFAINMRFIGVNARLDEIQAAVLRVKLPYLEQWNTARQAHAKFYSEHLQEIVAGCSTCTTMGNSSFYVYVIQVQERDTFRQALEQEGIATGIHYPTPIHLQPACARYGYVPQVLPIQKRPRQRIVSLPLYPELTTEQTQRL